MNANLMFTSHIITIVDNSLKVLMGVLNKSLQHSIGYMSTFQLEWWKNTPGISLGVTQAAAASKPDGWFPYMKDS